MNALHDPIFHTQGFRAEILFVGTRCAAHHTQAGDLHFVRAGCAEVLAADAAPVRIDQPSLVFFPTARPHRMRALDDDGIDVVCARAHFDDSFGGAMTQSFPAAVVLPLAQLQPIQHLLQSFYEEAASAAPGSRQMAERLCEVVLGHVVRHVLAWDRCEAGPLAAAADRRIAAALQVIHTRFPEELDLHLLAREAGMSRTRFIERFKALVGSSPHHYLVNYRIGMAQRLLARRLPVKTVAGRVGYATVPAFVRRFKEVVGVSPAAWAK